MIYIHEMTPDEIRTFIRERLMFDDNPMRHKRFNMTGYEDKVGDCTLHNIGIVNTFADIGIYDHTDYLFLDFYKGSVTLYFKYFQTDFNEEYDFTGEGTVEIIYNIIRLTVLSGQRRRRRD